jgi:Ala-tRNA(Pro) deacylase
LVQDIYAFLAAQDISYDRHDHPAVFTVEESERLLPEMGGAATKNLFLRDEKGRRQFLVTVAASKKVDLRALASVLQSTKLSFGSADRLLRVLGVEPGSVTLLALANDPTHQVEVFLDRDLWDAAAVRCHPLVNTATLVISHAGLERFFQATGHPVKVVTIPERTDA